MVGAVERGEVRGEREWSVERGEMERWERGEGRLMGRVVGWSDGRRARWLEAGNWRLVGRIVGSSGSRLVEDLKLEIGARWGWSVHAKNRCLK